MGEIVAAAVVAHQPMVMVPERRPRRARRDRRRHHARSSRAIGCCARRSPTLEVDTFVIVDTHWFTTTEHVIAGAAHFSGLYTSDEMPRNICDLPYDYPGRARSSRRPGTRSARSGGSTRST